MTDQIKVGKFIASLRKEQGMTQERFAKKLGVTNKAVSKWETGKCLPDKALFTDICSLFNITVDELLDGEKSLNDKSADNIDNSKPKSAFNIIRVISFIALIISALCAVDLGINYAAALVPGMYDGLGTRSILHFFFGIFGDGIWTVEMFFLYFERSLAVLVVVIIENVILNFYIRRKRNN